MKKIRLITVLALFLSAGLVDAADIKTTIDPPPVQYKIMEVKMNDSPVFSIDEKGTIRGIGGRFIGKLTKAERIALEIVFKSRI